MLDLSETMYAKCFIHSLPRRLSADVVTVTITDRMYWAAAHAECYGGHRGGASAQTSAPTRGRERPVSEEIREGQSSGNTQLCRTYRKMHHSEWTQAELTLTNGRWYQVSSVRDVPVMWHYSENARRVLPPETITEVVYSVLAGVSVVLRDVWKYL